jgi:hypothetical protein
MFLHRLAQLMAAAALFAGALSFESDAFALSREASSYLANAKALVADTTSAQPTSVQALNLRQAARSLSVVLSEDPANDEALRLQATVQARIQSLSPQVDVAHAQAAGDRARQSLDRAQAMLTIDGADGMVEHLLVDAKAQIEVVRGCPQYSTLADTLAKQVATIEGERVDGVPMTVVIVPAPANN